ncbi:Alb1-domain-containing protein [Xylariomycetidae sp. FL0641]|nr:Alb1-domain-containing protein [Xylariomycetidae sp. FL0641]
MAKGGIAKKRKAPSVHSRAARRATSPGIDTDKSLKDIQPPPTSVDYRPSVLSIHHGAGISKKQKKPRNMSSKARKRHEKDQDRAAAIMERTQTKVAKSKGQARNIQSRRKTWDEINQQVPVEKKEGDSKVTVEEGSGDESSLDDEMEEAETNRQQGKTATAAVETAPAPTSMDEDNDGIL